MNSTLVLDNGASTIKAGFAHLDGAPRLISNAVVKPKGGGTKLYIGHEIEDCRDFFGLYYRRPFERGILCDWDTEKAILDTLFSPEGMNVDTRATSLLVTEPYFNLPAVQETYDQLIFEEYEFTSYLRSPSAPLLQYGGLFDQGNLPPPECFLIVDSGFSFTHIVPVMHGVMVLAGIRRIDVGGKLLTNHLKEIVSFRHWDLMEHTYVMNEVKEACCYVSNTFSEDLEICQANPRKNPIVQEYVLPDFLIRKRGYIRNGPGKTDPPSPPSDMNVDSDAPKPKDAADEPVLYMGNERFTVPELLFHPSDVGLDQSGLAQGIANSISSLPEELQGMFWSNIGLVGGNFNIPGIVNRLRTELRALAPSEIEISLHKASNPVTQTYLSARAFAQTPAFTSACITREEYLESGSNACRRKFGQNLRDGLGGGRGDLEVAMDVDADGGMEGGTIGTSRTKGKGTEKDSIGTGVASGGKAIRRKSRSGRG